MGIMPKPTRAALERKPMAVILHIRQTEDPYTTQERDYEWFENEDARREYVNDLVTWAEQDFKENGDLFYLVAEITDTKQMDLGQFTVVCGDADEWPLTAEQIETEFRNDPTLLYSPRGKAVDAGKSKGNGAPAKVRGRKASGAAAAVKTEDPKPRAQQVKRAAKKSQAAKKAEEQDSGSAPQPRARRAAKKTAAKKAAAASDSAPKPRRARRPAAKAEQPEPDVDTSVDEESNA